MANEKEKNSKMDALLKQVFLDDLPSETERGMKSQFTQFKKNIERADELSSRTSRMVWRRFFLPRAWDWSRRVIRKEVLAFSSITMIIVGGFLHVSGHHNTKTETLSFLNTTVSVANQLREAESMECRIHLAAEDGLYLIYTIRWLSPEMTRVDVYDGETASKSLWITGSEIAFADLINKTFQKYHSIEQIEDPVFLPVLQFLSPSNLYAAIYKKWEPRQHRKQAVGQTETYVYVNEGGKVILEMTVDLNTSLPMTIKRYPSNSAEVARALDLTMEAYFIWDKPISPQLFIPQKPKDNSDN